MEPAAVSGLIDTTEMYLRTILELEEEGVVPMRARIAERLEQSGPTVSQTVSRMERDGLLMVAGDRRLEFTEEGRRLAVRVMRKHRLAECLLVGVIKLPWEEVVTLGHFSDVLPVQSLFTIAMPSANRRLFQG